MSKFLAAGHQARSVASCLIGLFCLAACSNAGQQATSLARPQHRGHTAQALSTGYAGTAQFDAPVVDPNTWQGSPIGTGSWSTTATPPASGGPQAIGFYDAQSGQTAHFLMVGNFAGSGTFFGIISDGQALSLGTSAINNTTLYAGIFDAATGDPVALATSGTLTLTAAGLIGGRITGSFTGTLDDVATTGCTSSAQCAPGDVCVSGSCVRQGCTSSAQCATGQTCLAGQCVATPGCTSNAQCAAGQLCQSGQCVVIPGCTSNAQCAAGQLCQSGQCVVIPGCTSNAQCAAGQLCQSGQCVTAPACTNDAQCGPGKACQAGQCVTVVAPPTCEGMQGLGSYAGKADHGGVCSVFSNLSNVSNAFAVIATNDAGGLSLYVMDPAQDSAGLVFPLGGCPSAGMHSVTGAVYWDQITSRGVTFYAANPATSATILFSKVGARVAGDFWVSLVGGGQLKGSFDVQ